MKKRLLTVFIFLCLAPLAWAAAPVPLGTYEIDSAHSKVGFEIGHLVISSVEGRFNGFTGDVVVGKKPEASQVNARIDTDSIDTGMDRRDNHLRGADFFDVKKYPVMTFKSKTVVWNEASFKMTGDLTIQGVTKEVTMDGKYLGSVKDHMGNERLAAQAGTTINRKDFGLTWNKLIEAGPVVGDEVTISMKIEATRKAETKKSSKATE